MQPRSESEAADVLSPVVVNVAASPVPQREFAVLPWESQARFVAIWTTARVTTNDAVRVARTLNEGSVTRALLFAIIAELLALASLVAVVLPLVHLTLPSLLVSVPPQELALLLATSIAAPALLLVVLHVWWACSVEVGVLLAGGSTHWMLGLRLAFYACGWDLVTSPLGAIIAWYSEGRQRTASLLRAAVQAPRRSVMAHLSEVRRLTPEKAKRALLVAGLFTGGPLMMALIVFFVWLIRALV